VPSVSLPLVSVHANSDDFECKGDDVADRKKIRALEGSTAVVTGAGRGIGKAIALALADAGAEVIAVARSADDLAQLAAECPGVTAHPADVVDPDFHSWLTDQPLDILINNAGTNTPLPVTEVTAAVLDRMLDINVRAAYLVAQAAVRAMMAHGRGGSIVNMSSQMGHVGSPNRSVYCMTKHAIEGMTKAMAVELAPHRIRVNSLAPTFVATDWTARMFADPAFEAFVLGMIPAGRLATPEEVSAACLYLVSPAAAMVTGTSLRIDGGWTAR
jgi:NAD(P)-dependent dehydrogenase (short-subunit alcohol dehydrogenase family)